MKKLSLLLILSVFALPTFADHHEEDTTEETVKKCESWKQERGNKYRKVPGSRLVCADKEEEK